METRQDLRISVNCPVQYSGKGFTGQGTLLNVSTGGYGVRSSQSIPDGTQMSLRVCLPDGQEPFEVGVEAVWGKKSGIVGMRSLPLPQSEGKRLRRYIVTHTKKSDLVYFMKRQ